MFQKKKGDSMMVSYVLLIVIAVAISGLVYSYLKLYVPTEGVECNEEIYLTIDSVDCNNETQMLSVQLSNGGLFNVDRAFIRFAEANRTVRTQLNINDTLLYNLADSKPVLAPGDRTPAMRFSINSSLRSGVQEYVLEVQPAITKERRIVPCKNKIVTRPVTCG